MKIGFSRLIWYISPLLVISFAAIGLIRSNTKIAPDHYADRNIVAGCYTDLNGNHINLASGGTITVAGKEVGKYVLLSPVPGKHGYLVEASDLSLKMRESHLWGSRGDDSFFWDVDANRLKVVFAPANTLVFTKLDRCS